jgi:transposase
VSELAFARQDRAARKDYVMQVQNTRFFVGVDVCKKSLEVSVRPLDLFMRPAVEKQSLPNSPEGVRALVKLLKNFNPELVTMESTGGLERLAARGLAENGISVAVVNPRRVSKFAEALDERVKTDPIDADVLALYGLTANPRRYVPPTLAEEERSAIQTRRHQLNKMLVAEKNHLASALPCMHGSILRHIALLQEEIQSINDRLSEMLDNDLELRLIARRLATAKGIGKVASAAILVWMPEVGKISNKAAAKLLGTAPLADDSGEKKGKRSCFGGRAELRALLYMPTLTAIRCNPAIKDFYARLISKGKHHRVAIIACMRKLLVTLNAMVRDGRDWDPNHALSR